MINEIETENGITSATEIPWIIFSFFFEIVALLRHIVIKSKVNFIHVEAFKNGLRIEFETKATSLYV